MAGCRRSTQRRYKQGAYSLFDKCVPVFDLFHMSNNITKYLERSCLNERIGGERASVNYGKITEQTGKNAGNLMVREEKTWMLPMQSQLIRSA